MSEVSVSLADYIREMAVRTGAPDAFVETVRVTFASKGIALEECASPYQEAIETAFMTDASIRQGSDAAMERVARLDADFNRFRETCARHAEEIREAQESLDLTAQRLESAIWRVRSPLAIVIPFPTRTH